MARFNEVKLPENFMDMVVDDDEKCPEKGDEGSKARFNITNLFRTPIIRFRLFILVFVWLTNNLVSYGLHLSTGSLGVNIYLAFFISGIVEMASSVVSILASDVFGRKIGIISAFLIAGLASFVAIFLSPGSGKTAVAMIGRFGTSASWSIGALYVCEVLPTSIRNVGMGVCSTASRLIAIATPLILLLADLWEPAPLVIQTVMALVTVALCMFLPETRGEKLPETIEDGENFGRNQKRFLGFMPLRRQEEEPNTCASPEASTNI